VHPASATNSAVPALFTNNQVVLEATTVSAVLPASSANRR